MAKVVVCLLTYGRLEYAKRTLQTCLDNILVGHPHPPVSVHIASDGDSPEYINELVDLAGGFITVQGVSVTNSHRGGYGKNINLATQVIHQFADYVLMLEDDWELTQHLNLNELIADMEEDRVIDCVRLGYLSHTQPLFGEVRAVRNSHYLLLDPDSPEPHVFAGHPRLESVARQRAMGLWQEGRPPGETEFMMSHILRARRGVAWPMDLVHPRGDLFAHIGSVRSY